MHIWELFSVIKFAVVVVIIIQSIQSVNNHVKVVWKQRRRLSRGVRVRSKRYIFYTR